MSFLKESVDNKKVIDVAVIQVQAGDTAAYATIIEILQKNIYLYCYYLLGKHEEAEDAAQEIFIKGFSNIGSYAPRVSFSAWIYKITHNHCMDILKKRTKLFKALQVIHKDLSQAKEHEYEYTDVIHALLENLSLQERRILLLRALEEYSFEEIGLIMDLKSATVRKKYERLRKRLIQQQAKGGQEYGHALRFGK